MKRCIFAIAQLFIIVAVTLPLGNAAKGEIFRWEYNGRLISVDDPDKVLPDLRLGDPVSGFLQVDTTLSLFLEHEYLGGLVRFQSLSFEATNPRNGESVASPPAVQDPPLWFAIDLSDTGWPFPGPEFMADQSFAGSESEDPENWPWAYFEGKSPLPDDGNPAQINVDDTVISYEAGDAFLAAAVFQLTPVEIPLGDLDTDLNVDQADVDTLSLAISTESQNEFYDLNNDGVVDKDDHDFWITEIANTSPGDTNLDGAVDFADFLVLSSNFGTVGGWAEGNFDLEPAIAFADFLLLSSNFGSGQLVATVPESTFTPLLAWIVLTLSSARLRRGSNRTHALSFLISTHLRRP